METDKILLLVGSGVGGVLLLLFIWTFISNAQFGLTLLAAKDSVGFVPFIGTFFLYMLGFYFILMFIGMVVVYIYLVTQPPQQQSLPVQ
jgi:hypothetical protein